jgi:hypothetical protein
MKKLILAAVAAAAAFVASAPAQAQVNHREWRQHERIERGYHRGDINPREYRRLRHQQARIDRYENRSRWNDGRLSWRERNRLNRMQNRASRNIYRERHDRQRRDWR